MAEIKPINGWRYSSLLAATISDLTSPLFDVVSPNQRGALYQHPYNSIHLSVPKEPEPANQAAALLQQWKATGILQQDVLPGIYVYYQYFRLPGSAKEYCRKGFMCHLRLYDWPEQILLRHENTIPHSVNDRIALLEKTLWQSSATHGLYTDPDFSLEPYMDESMRAPIYEIEDYQGTRDVLAVIQDAAVVQKFIQVLENKQILLADGHHRYEASLALRHKLNQENPHPTGQEAYNYHFMYLTNTEANDLIILPTHRVVTAMSLTDEEFLNQVAAYFTVTELPDAYGLNEVIAGKKWTFGLYLSGKAYKIKLKPEVHQNLYWNFPPEVKNLDLTVLHYFIFERILGIVRAKQRSHPSLQYIRNFTQCLSLVDAGKARLALITNQVTMPEVKEVCYSGAMLPQKSTFFYPKVITGLLFSSIKQDEFEPETNSCFQLAPAQRVAE